MSPPGRLGPFRLLAPLGRGGMADVWDAVHEPSGQAVAVKMVRGATPSLAAHFAAEVRAAASLDHPSIVRVFDAGTTPRSFAGAQHGDLPAHAPYLVMERAEGTLADVLDDLPWEVLQDAMLQLLDALGFVHACGFVHRDVKPLNVLLGCRHDPLERLDGPIGGLRLADFGIVWDARSAPDGAQSGSASMMAPEQRAGRRADFGPWTDLYAVGRIVQSWARGGLAAPLGLPAWIRRMTGELPTARPDRAAVAAAELRGLGPAVAAPGAATDELDDAPTRPVVHALTPPSVVVEGLEPVDVEVLAPPSHWSAPRAIWPTVPIAAAGLGLQRHREPSPVGRSDLRQSLWRDLLEVVDGGTAKGRSLVGPVGSGREHLAEWTARCAHAAGTVAVLRLRTGTLVDALRRSCRLEGCDQPAMEARLRALWGATWSAAPTAAWLARPTLRSPLGALADVVARVAACRPVVVVAPDLEPGSVEESLCELLATCEAPLLVLTTTTQGSDRIPPLEEGEMEALLRAWLPFTPDTLGRLVGYGDGSPGRVLQALTRTTTPLRWTRFGFEWRPSTAGQATRSWVAATLQVVTADVTTAVQLASLREPPIGLADWAELEPVAPEALRILLDRGLAVSLDGRHWDFVDAGVRQALHDSLTPRERAALELRWARHDLARGDRGHSAGRHLLGAGQRDAGATLLLEAAREARDAGRLRLSERILSPLLTGDDGPTDRPWGEAAALWLRGSDHPVALRKTLAGRLLQVALQHDWADLEAAATADLALLDDVPPAESVRRLEGAVARAVEGGAPAVARRIQGNLAMVLLNSGDLAGAEHAARALADLPDRDEVREALVWAWVHHTARRPDEARRHATTLIRLASERAPTYEATGWHALACVEQAVGRLDDAREACERGLAVLRMYPHQRDELRLRETLAGVFYFGGQVERSRVELTRTLVLHRQMGRPAVVPLVSMALADTKLERWGSLALVCDGMEVELADHALGRFSVACFRALLEYRAGRSTSMLAWLERAVHHLDGARIHPLHGVVVEQVASVDWPAAAHEVVARLRGAPQGAR